LRVGAGRAVRWQHLRTGRGMRSGARLPPDRARRDRLLREAELCPPIHVRLFRDVGLLRTLRERDACTVWSVLERRLRGSALTGWQHRREDSSGSITVTKQPWSAGLDEARTDDAMLQDHQSH
jgi:hypothetical protein